MFRSKTLFTYKTKLKKKVGKTSFKQYLMIGQITPLKHNITGELFNSLFEETDEKIIKRELCGIYKMENVVWYCTIEMEESYCY